MNKAQQLAALKQRLIDDQIGAELAKTANQLVFGVGNSGAQVVFIGEAPGKKEDEQGIPFVGAAGKFLDEMLASVDLERADIYITNIVKYRPPNNRDPLPEEKQEFSPYLLKELAIIEPTVIATLGRHSMGFFLPEAKISEVHGQPTRKKIILPSGEQSQWLILPLYHPAAALYNGGMRQTLIDDFQVVKSLLD